MHVKAVAVVALLRTRIHTLSMHIQIIPSSKWLWHLHMKQPQHINKQVPTYKIITAYYEKATYNEKAPPEHEKPTDHLIDTSNQTR